MYSVGPQVEFFGCGLEVLIVLVMPFFGGGRWVCGYNIKNKIINGLKNNIRSKNNLENDKHMLKNRPKS